MIFDFGFKIPNARLLLVIVVFVLVAGCRQKMADQPRYDPLEPSAFFEDGLSARELVPGTVARGRLQDDAHLHEGLANGVPAKTFPFPVTLDLLRRGRERFDIYCSPCHSRTGNGDGMIVRRGFSRPPSFHTQRLRDLPPGHFFRVITRGFGAMPDYRYQVEPHDRWAIIAYIRALQLSQNAPLAALPPEERSRLEGEVQ
jgi:hypothetical protein